jgi:hypothetical protein
MTRRNRGLGTHLAGNDPIHPPTVGLLRLELEPELLAYHSGKKAPHRVRLPTSGAHDSGNGGAARPAQQCKDPRLFRIRSRLAMAGDPAASCLRPELGGRLRLCGSRTLAIGHAKIPLNRVDAISRRHHLKPAEAKGAGVGRGASGQASPAVTTTHTLHWREKSSANCAMVLLKWLPPDRQKFLQSRDAPRLPSAPRRPPAEFPASTPELRLSGPAAQTRIVSVVTFGLSPGNLHDLSKG